MTSRDLEAVAQTLVAEGKEILAADETVPTLTRRFDTLGIRLDQGKPPHLPGNALYLPWRRRVHQRCHNV